MRSWIGVAPAGAGAALFAGALAAAALFAGAAGLPRRAAAQGEDLIARMTRAFDAAEKEDARAAAAFLSDESWIVRRFTAVRLRAMGMPEEAFAKVVACARPGSEKPAGEALAGVEKWVGAYKAPEGGSVPIPTGRMDVLTAITGMLEEEIVRRGAAPGVGRDMAGALIGLLPSCANDEERDWVARRTLRRLDRAGVLSDLKLAEWPADPAGAQKACADLAAWYQANAAYLYAHPLEGRVYVDAAARAKGTPSETYRQANPWGEGEGPNRPAVREDRPIR
ncbi:MAG: hypothetical protein HZA54_10400 [Planctomycetes bacterium]|nr:hypothetical protein [Planctomycetota bacterium]